MTPSYWNGGVALVDPVSLTGGSVASRGQRSKARHLTTSLGDLGGNMAKRRKRGSASSGLDALGDGDNDGTALLQFNELGLSRKKKLIFGKSVEAPLPGSGGGRRHRVRARATA